MNIHEIITAWEDNNLPRDLDALAAAQNKVDDYLKKATAGKVEANNVIVKDMYNAEVYCYSVISGSIQQLIDAVIPEPKINARP